LLKKVNYVRKLVQIANFQLKLADAAFLLLLLFISLSGCFRSCSPKMGEFDLDELAKKESASLFLPLTSALSDKLQAAVQPVVDSLDKLINPMSENQSPATHCWVEPQLYSIMAEMMQMGRNEMEEINERAVFIAILPATAEDATKEKDETMLREAISACDTQTIKPDQKDLHHSKLRLNLRHIVIYSYLTLNTLNSCDFIDFTVLSIDAASNFSICRDPEVAASEQRHIDVAADLPILLSILLLPEVHRLVAGLLTTSVGFRYLQFPSPSLSSSTKCLQGNRDCGLFRRTVLAVTRNHHWVF
uniref:BAR domain-containing protein n=1 Tax=Toxocara canis TaxID=6265 RepID=A0A183U6A8_TOXCA